MNSFFSWTHLLIKTYMLNPVIFAYLLFLSLASCNQTNAPAALPTILKTDAISKETQSGQLDFNNYLPIISTPQPELSCTQSSFGTMLVGSDPADWISSAEVMLYANEQLGLKGMVATGSPSEDVRDAWFSQLPGWTRYFIRGTYDQLIPIENTTTLFGMQDMYECIGYGPESTHQAGEEALEPHIWVPMAEEVAESAGKCLIYGPAVLDYERMATPGGENQYEDVILADLIAEVSPHVDVWMIQLAKYQRWTDKGRDDAGNEYTRKDFIDWVDWWVTQIKTANPNAKVWTQLGIGLFDPIQKACLPPQTPEYILNYRQSLTESGVDGIFVMPSQPCQESTDPQDHEYYLQSLLTLQQAIELACGQ